MGSLKFLFGRSGSGKTTAVFEALAANYSENRCFLIVPDQFTYASERTLLENLGPQSSQKITVDGFAHLAETVLKETGRPSGKPLDMTARVLLMSRAVDTVADKLQIYRKQVNSPQFIYALVAALGEYKQCGLSAERFNEIADKFTETTPLRLKMQELSLIYCCYEALVAENYVDPLDDLDRLADRIPQSRLLDGVYVWVDGFRDFTAQEMRVLEALLCRTASVTVSLCVDDTESELFSRAVRTANHLRSFAHARGITVETPRLFTDNLRTDNTALKAIEAQIYRFDKIPFEEVPTNVSVVSCSDIYEECRYVSDAIRLLLQQGVRCRDIAVTVRDLDRYLGRIEPIMKAAGIPFYTDRRGDALTEPPVLMVSAALRAVIGNFNTDDMLALLKCPLSGDFSVDDIAAVEEYVGMWHINHDGWLREWRGSAKGFAAEYTSNAHLDHLNRVREQLTAPLITLKAALKTQPTVTGREFSTAVYRYLQSLKVGERLNVLAEQAKNVGDPDAFDRYKQLWELLMQQLDRFVDVLEKTPISLERLTGLFILTAGALDYGKLPQGLDTVQIGSADRMRYSAPQYVFLLGANEGLFPAITAESGLFSGYECEKLREMDLQLGDTPEDAHALEQFCVYRAVSAPSKGLYVSFLRQNTDGVALKPSDIIAELTAILPALQIADAQSIPPQSESSAFHRLAAQSGTVEELAVLREVLGKNPLYSARLAALDRAGKARELNFVSSDVADDFFGEKMTVSPSQVETYGKCRFQYFCKYGLQIKAPREAELGSLEFGTFVHYVLENMIRGYAEAGMLQTPIAAETVKQDVEACVNGYISAYLDTADITNRLFSQIEQLKRLCVKLVRHILSEMKQSQFVPVAFEQPINNDEGSTSPIHFKLSNEKELSVTGKVDRVDTYKNGDQTYLRVIDYKTGSKEFKLSEVADGLNLQMLIYLFTLCQNGIPDTVPKDAKYAGILYLPSKVTDLISDGGKNALCANGLLIDDTEILRAMELNLEGIYIPYSSRSKKPPLASFEQFGILKKKIEHLLCDMGEQLYNGRIAPTPCKTGQNNVCDYCEYRPICRHSEADGFREENKLKPDELWKIWEEEEKADGRRETEV